MAALVAALVALCALSVLGGLLVVRRVMGGVDAADSHEVGLVRVRAQVANGAEQTLVALVRELRVQRGSDCAAYGDLYLDSGAIDGMTIRTVSALDRGLIAPLTLRRGTGCTEVTYAIVQLPQDEDLHAIALDFESRLIAALRRLDPTCEVRLAGTALRDLDGAVWAPADGRRRTSRRRDQDHLERLPAAAELGR